MSMSTIALLSVSVFEVWLTSTHMTLWSLNMFGICQRCRITHRVCIRALTFYYSGHRSNFRNQAICYYICLTKIYVCDKVNCNRSNHCWEIMFISLLDRSEYIGSFTLIRHSVLQLYIYIIRNLPGKLYKLRASSCWGALWILKF